MEARDTYKFQQRRANVQAKENTEIRFQRGIMRQRCRFFAFGGPAFCLALSTFVPLSSFIRTPGWVRFAWTGLPFSPFVFPRLPSYVLQMGSCAWTRCRRLVSLYLPLSPFVSLCLPLSPAVSLCLLCLPLSPCVSLIQFSALPNSSRVSKSYGQVLLGWLLDGFL